MLPKNDNSVKLFSEGRTEQLKTGIVPTSPTHTKLGATEQLISKHGFYSKQREKLAKPKN